MHKFNLYGGPRCVLENAAVSPTCCPSALIIEFITVFLVGAL